MKRQVIVFDFDGTIADSEPVMLKIYDEFAQTGKFPKMTKKAYRKLRNGTARDAMRWAGVKLWELPQLIRLGKEEFKKHVSEILLFDGVVKVIEELDKQADIFVLSSNSSETVKSILATNRLDTEAKTLKGSSIFGKDRTLNKIIKENNYDPKVSWMIGDEVRDIVAGKKAGLNTIAVTWGLQGQQALKKANPDKIVNKPEEILRLLKE